MSNTSEMKKITIVDIAKRLGISASTVSRALNGIGRMNADTRQQIICVTNNGYEKEKALPRHFSMLV